MPKKVLCAIDGSRPSERAVQYAVRWAKETGSELRFIHVSRVSAETAAKTHYWDDTLFGVGERQIAKELQAAVASASGAGLAGASGVTVSGRDVASAIIGYAQEQGFDHIVMGSHGHTALGHLLTGSVVSDVLSKPHPPVTVV